MTTAVAELSAAATSRPPVAFPYTFTRAARERRARRAAAGVVIIDPYCRISKDYDGTLRSVETQEDDGRYCIEDEHGYEVGQVFRDPFLSAWDPKVVREEFHLAMQRIANGESDGIWVYDLTRFSRQPIEGEWLIHLGREGVKVLSNDSTYDLTTGEGRKRFRDAMSDAANESDKISQRTTRGKRKKAGRGKSNASYRGYAMPGYLPNPAGWEQGDPRTPAPAGQVEHEREIVQEMARRILAGEHMNDIVRDLKTRGELSVNGNVWTNTTIRSTLMRPSIAGLVEYDGKIVGKLAEFSDDNPPPLDRDTYDRLQSLFNSRKRGRVATVYHLSGAMTCGRCGSRMQGRPRAQNKRYPDGEVRRQYWCQLRSHGVGCGRVAIDQRYADAMVRAAVIARLGDPRHVNAIARQAAAVTDARSEIVADIARLEHEANELASKLGTSAFFTIERVAGMSENVARLIDKARARLAAVEENNAPLIPADDVAAQWDAFAAEGNLDALRRMVKDAFPRLAVLPATAKQRGPAAMTPERFAWFGAEPTHPAAA